MRFLQRAGYRFVTAEELIVEGGPHGKTAALTFDDGFRSWLTDVLPLLQRLGVRATFYVCPACTANTTGTCPARRGAPSTKARPACARGGGDGARVAHDDAS